MRVCVCVQRALWRMGGGEKVNSCSSLSHTSRGIIDTHARTPAPKGSSREARRCLCAGQISHVSLLQHTDRSSQCSRLHEGQVHAEGGRGRGERRKVERREVATQTASFFSLFSHFLLVSYPSPLLHRPPPLSAEESGPSIGIEAPLKVIQKCNARCLHSPPFPPSLPTALPCPSPQTTLHPQLPPTSTALWGRGGLDPQRATVLQILATA